MTAGLERALASRRAVALVIALVMALAATSISIGFLTDDHSFRAALRSTSTRAPAAYDLFRFVPGDLEGNQLRIRAGHLPWWAAADLKIHFLRPLASLAFVADTHLFGDAPLGYHLDSLAWYLALLLAAALLFRRVLPPAAATLALAMFGLAAAHVEAYAWISARHEVLAGALAAAALAALCSHRRGLALGLLVVGLASSEAALAAVPIWVALELAGLAPAARAWRRRVVACVPVVALALAYLVAYAALGGGTRGSGGYHDPMADPLGFVALAAVRVPLLLGDAALGIPAELAHVVAEWRLAVLGLAAVGIVGLAWWLTRGATSRAPSRRFGALPGPVLAWLVAGGIGGTVLGAAGYPAGRVLLIPDLAFAAVLGLVLYRGLAAGWPGRVAAALLAIVHLVIAPLATRHTIAKLAQRARATEAITADIVTLAPPDARVFVVAASDPMVFLYPRGILADTAPGTVRCWSVWSAARASHRVTRTADHVLAIEPVERPLLDGSFDQLFRAGRPFAVGDQVEQCGATIRVTAVRDGRPSRLEVELRRSFDDPAIALLTWRDHELVRFTPPGLGETVELPWSAGPSGAL